jgi:hypothetical protein
VLAFSETSRASELLTYSNDLHGRQMAKRVPSARARHGSGGPAAQRDLVVWHHGQLPFAGWLDAGHLDRQFKCHYFFSY